MHERSDRHASPSFDDFARASFPSLVRYAYLLSGDWALAEDMAQDALLSTHAKWRRVQTMEHPHAYVRRAVMRRFLSWRRLRSSGETPTAELPERESAGIDHAHDAAERDAMWAHLTGLPRQQRAVIVLRYYEDLPDDRIAELLGCSQSTVRVHAARALATLRQQMPAPARRWQDSD